MESLQNYRSLLRDVLTERKKKNAQYSLRSFAKHLGIQPSFLSLILSGKRDISESMVTQFAEKLQLSAEDTSIFELLVRLEKANQHSHKVRILEQLQALDPKFGTSRDLGIDQFRMISEWYHFAILTLIEIQDFPWSISNVAKTLKIDPFELEQALERLSALEMIEYTRGERPRKLDTRYVVGSAEHQEAIKKYHVQMLQKVILAQTEQLPSERFTGTENLAFSPDQIQEAHEILEKCLQKLIALSKKHTTKAEVYHAEMHLIRLSQNQNLKGAKK